MSQPPLAQSATGWARNLAFPEPLIAESLWCTLICMMQTDSHVNATFQYRYDDSGESGREWITLTANTQGNRTIRALCELDDVGLRRDATINYGPGFRARDG